MAYGRPSRRIAPASLCLLASALAASGCQRSLLQPPQPQPAVARRPIEPPRTFEPVGTSVLDPVEVQAAPEPVSPPARLAVARASRPEPTPMLDAIAARSPSAQNSSEDHSTGVKEAPKQEEPTDSEKPSGKDAPSAAPEAVPQVVKVPSSEAPPISGPETKVVIEVPPRIAPEEVPAPLAPGDLWQSGLKELRTLASEQAGKPDGAEGEWPLRLALLDWMSGETEKPGAAPWRPVLAPLVRVNDDSAGDQSALAAELRKAVESLDALAPLEVTAVALCRRVHGYGSYDPIEPGGCKAGRAVIVYCEMSGLRYEPEGDQFNSRVSSQIELRPRNGGQAVWTRELGVAEDSCRRRRRDYYVNYRLDLPDDLAPGAYELILTQTDMTTQRTASRGTSLVVRP